MIANYKEIIAFRKSLKVGETKVIDRFTVARESVMRYTVTTQEQRGNGYPEPVTVVVVGAGTLQDHIAREYDRKPHDAGRESDLPENLRPL